MERFESRIKFGVLNLVLDSAFLRVSGACGDSKRKAGRAR